MATLRGTSGNDNLTGTSTADSIFGYAGDDVLTGGGGNDVLYGGAGDDVFAVSGLIGFNSFRGDAGVDTIRVIGGTTTATFIVSTAAKVEVLAFTGSDLTGTAGADRFDISGISTIIAGRMIWLNDGDDRFLGSSATDQVHGGLGDDDLDGGGGDDVIEGAQGHDRLSGGAGNDRFILRGDIGIDTIQGDGGTDRLVFTGGAQTSRFTVTAASSVEIMRFDGGRLDGTSGMDTFDISGISTYENRQIIRLVGGDDVFIGSRAGDFVEGGDGDDVLSGGGGNDLLAGDGGNDIMDGGSGNDVFRVADWFGADTYRGGSGTDTIQFTGGAITASFTADAASEVEVLRFVGHDLIGTDGDDEFDLSGIITILNGRTIWLNDGDDSFIGARTSDDIHGGDGNDRLYTGTGNDVIEGGNGNDDLDGGSGNDIFRVQGDFGIDTIQGGSGQDSLQIVAAAGTSRLMLNTAASVEQLAFAGQDLIGTDGNDLFDLSGVATITGGRTIWLNAGTDVFIGSRDADDVHGGTGDDALKGGTGADILNGGSGSDRFIYQAIADSTLAAGGRDRIDGFSRVDGDRIDLSLIDADTGLAGHQRLTFVGAGGYSSHTGEVRIAAISTGLMIYADVNGDNRTDMSILVTGISTLQAGDFIL